MLSFLLSLGLSFGAIDLETLSPKAVEQIAQEVISTMQPELHTKPTLMITERPEPTPLGALSFPNGKCVVIINTSRHAWSQWGRFLNKDNKDNWNAMIATSVAHEMGHCLREGREFVSSYATPATELQGVRDTGASTLSKRDIVYKQELFADAVAILYAKEHAGEAAGAVIKTWIDAREQHGANEPTHNTSAVLSRLIELETCRQENETLGYTALRLLASL